MTGGQYHGSLGGTTTRPTQIHDLDSSRAESRLRALPHECFVFGGGHANTRVRTAPRTRKPGGKDISAV
jgi:hypothetical protein